MPIISQSKFRRSRCKQGLKVAIVENPETKTLRIWHMRFMSRALGNLMGQTKSLTYYPLPLIKGCFALQNSYALVADQGNTAFFRTR
jgi:hypothetical protein